jgi:hypothetical protein
MLGHDMGSAAARRDGGVRKVSRLTWGAGAVGVICSAVIAVAFGYHADAEAAQQGGSQHSQQGTILVPNQPPAPVKGAGQVTSGAS